MKLCFLSIIICVKIFVTNKVRLSVVLGSLYYVFFGFNLDLDSLLIQLRPIDYDEQFGMVAEVPIDVLDEIE